MSSAYTRTRLAMWSYPSLLAWSNYEALLLLIDSYYLCSQNAMRTGHLPKGQPVETSSKSRSKYKMFKTY